MSDSVSSLDTYKSQPQDASVASSWGNGNAVIQVQPSGVTFVFPYSDSSPSIQYAFIIIAGIFAFAYLIRSYARFVEARKS